MKTLWLIYSWRVYWSVFIYHILCQMFSGRWSKIDLSLVFLFSYHLTNIFNFPLLDLVSSFSHHICSITKMKMSEWKNDHWALRFNEVIQHPRKLWWDSIHSSFFIIYWYKYTYSYTHTHISWSFSIMSQWFIFILTKS